jgi:hypothetical protein
MSALDQKTTKKPPSPLYTPKALAATKKRNTTRDIDGAYRYGGRKETLARTENVEKEAA